MKIRRFELIVILVALLTGMFYSRTGASVSSVVSPPSCQSTEVVSFISNKATLYKEINANYLTCFRLTVPPKTSMIKLTFDVHSGAIDLYHSENIVPTFGTSQKMNKMDLIQGHRILGLPSPLPGNHTFAVMSVGLNSRVTLEFSLILEASLAAQPQANTNSEGSRTAQNYDEVILTLRGGESIALPFVAEGPGTIGAVVFADVPSGVEMSLKSPDNLSWAGVKGAPLPLMGAISTLSYQVTSDIFRTMRNYELSVRYNSSGQAKITIGINYPGFSRQVARQTNIDLLGLDYAHIPIPQNNLELCQAKCIADPRCVAYTFSRALSDGTQAVCHLKEGLPLPTANNCCISGVVVVRELTREFDTDRAVFWADYSHFALKQNSPDACRAECALDPACAAFTYVYAGINSSSAECYLKKGVPGPTSATCCVSGMSLYRTANREAGTDRMGGDYMSFTVTPPFDYVCRDACLRDPKCAAYTYVQGGTNNNPPARCYLKNVVPARTGNSNCISGVITRRNLTMEVNTDLMGSNYHKYEMADPIPEQCRTSCAIDPNCRAYTYVNPGVQGSNAVCYLKSSVPAASQNTCCVSGVVK